MIVEKTSFESYLELRDSGLLSERQQTILDAIRELGSASDSMITKYLGKVDPNYVRPRRKELLDLGLIVPAFEGVCQVTGRHVYFWEVSKFPLVVSVKPVEKLVYAVFGKEFEEKGREVTLLAGKKELAEKYAKPGEIVKALRVVL